ncbi:MAG: tetratricopeptide repeat protein [Coriobacteriia bacterium]|nr:tetratricopeptide repeat protein [Coriobacteriia bacterium]
MTEVPTGSADERIETPSPLRPRGERSDLVLNVVLAALVVSVLALAAYFAYEVKATRAAQRAANPAYRVLEDLKQAVRENPNDPQARGLLAEAYGAVGRFKEAKRELRAAIDLDPDYSGAYMAIAKIAFIEKDYETAKGALNKVLEVTAGGEYEGINKRREEAYFHLGELALQEREYEEALGYFKAALRIRRSASDTYLRMAQAYLGLEERDAALNTLEAALAFDPKFPEANYEVGRLLLDSDKAAAAEYFRVALDGQPDAELAVQELAAFGDWRSYHEEARQALDAGNPEEALAPARIAAALAPAEYDAVLVHAQARERIGEAEQALGLYREAANLRPGDETAQSAVERLASDGKGGSK